MKNRFFYTLTFILLCTLSVSAQAVVIYVTDGDADNLFIVDTDTQTFQTIDTSGVPFSRASGLAAIENRDVTAPARQLPGDTQSDDSAADYSNAILVNRS